MALEGCRTALIAKKSLPSQSHEKPYVTRMAADDVFTFDDIEFFALQSGIFLKVDIDDLFNIDDFPSS